MVPGLTGPLRTKSTAEKGEDGRPPLGWQKSDCLRLRLSCGDVWLTGALPTPCAVSMQEPEPRSHLGNAAASGMDVAIQSDALQAATDEACG